MGYDDNELRELQSSLVAKLDNVASAAAGTALPDPELPAAVVPSKAKGKK